MVKWKHSDNGFYKCNIDGVSKRNPKPSSSEFCITNEEGEFINVETRRLNDCSVLITEVVVMRIGLEHCINNNLLSVVMEIDSLILKKILDVI